jgi:Probable lipid transfer
VAMKQTVFCLLLISQFLTTSLATDNVGETSIGFCQEQQNQQLMVEKCWAYIAKGKPKSKPSKQCCDAIKKIHQYNCFCELNQNHHKWNVDMGKVDASVKFCTRKNDLGDCLNVQSNNRFG